MFLQVITPLFQRFFVICQKIGVPKNFSISLVWRRQFLKNRQRCGSPPRDEIFDDTIRISGFRNRHDFLCSLFAFWYFCQLSAALLPINGRLLSNLRFRIVRPKPCHLVDFASLRLCNAEHRPPSLTYRVGPSSKLLRKS